MSTITTTCGFALGLAATLPLACLYVLRLFARRRHLLRFWYAIPGMIWAQFGWYNGIYQAAVHVQTAPE